MEWPVLYARLMLLGLLLVCGCADNFKDHKPITTRSVEQQFQVSQTDVITLPVDIEREKETQLSVEEGHQPWRLEADWVACSEIAHLHKDRKQKPDLDVRDCLDKRKVEQQGVTKAVIDFSVTDKKYRVYVERLVKTDGIWTPTKIEVTRR